MESPVRVLIADDDEICREILQEAIVKEGVEVVAAADGMEAVSILEGGAFDILISDLNMPRMDGLALLKHARQQYPHILTIIITGFGSLESAIEAIRLGAYDYVQKPFKVEEVMVAARNAIDKVKILRERAALLREVEALHQKLKCVEAGKGYEGAGGSHLAEAGSDQQPRYLVSRNSLPLYFLETPQDSPSQSLSTLENLKRLRSDGVITELEFKRLKSAFIEKIESGRL